MLMITAPLSGFVGLDIDFSWLDFSTKSSALDSSGSCGDNVTYTFESSTGLLTISGTGDMQNFDSSESPFYNYSFIKSVVINSGVTSIGDNAFEFCTGLTSITIPDSVKSIGTFAFYDCTGFTSIAIPDSVTSIGERAFYGCTGLTSITIPDSLKSIGDSAFKGCIGLTSISIPDSVTSIGCSAFYFCTGLISITIPDSVISIGDAAFDFTSVKDVYYSGTEEEWNVISFSSNNEPLLKANIHYNSSGITGEGEYSNTKKEFTSNTDVVPLDSSFHIWIRSAFALILIMILFFLLISRIRKQKQK